MTRVSLIAVLVATLSMAACHEGTHAMQESATVMASGGGQIRTYYIAADEITWDYVPGGIDGISGEPFTSIGFFRKGTKPGAPPMARPVPTSYVKALYREYTDASFSTLKPRS